jgi:hypothetical protein
MPTLFAFTVTVVGAFPLEGVELSQPESADAAQLIAPPALLLTVMFCPAGASELAPKKFREVGVEARTAWAADTANVTGMLRVEFCAPYEVTVMVAL